MVKTHSGYCIMYTRDKTHINSTRNYRIKAAKALPNQDAISMSLATLSTDNLFGSNVALRVISRKGIRGWPYAHYEQNVQL